MEKADPTSFAYKPNARPMLGEDGNSELLRDRLHTYLMASVDIVDSPQMGDSIEDDVVDDGLQLSTLVEEETHNVIADLLNKAEDQVTSVHRTIKILPTKGVDGHYIYKSTFVSQLNGIDFLSKDELAKIKHSIQFNNHDNCLMARSSRGSSLLYIGSNCGVHFVQRSTTRLLSTVNPLPNGKGDVQ